MPKATYGQLWAVNREALTAVLGLGSLQKVAAGDVFEIGSPKGGHWKLTITHVEPRLSHGKLELLTRSQYEPHHEPPVRMEGAKWMGK